MPTIRYHINNAGEVRLCKASLMPCRFKEHYENENEAVSKAEEILALEEQFISTITKFNKSKNQPAFKGLLNNDKFKKLDSETRKIVASAILKMNNKSKDQRLWQAIYDSTPVGQLTLKRAKTSDKDKRIERAKKVSDLSNSIEYNEDIINLEDLDTPLKKNIFTNKESAMLKQSNNQLKDAESKLTLLSASWMSSLTVDEIDTIHWITGHGSGILNNYMSGKEHPLAHEYTKEFLEEKARHFTSAMSKAPELDEAIVFYRGAEHKNAIKNELSNVASSSYSNKVASNFAENKSTAVIIEIKTKKVPSVVAMSEWGINELEIFAPLGKYKQINEFTDDNGTHIIQVEHISE